MFNSFLLHTLIPHHDNVLLAKFMMDSAPCCAAFPKLRSRGGICSAELGENAKSRLREQGCAKGDAEHRVGHSSTLEMTMIQVVWSFFHMSSRVFARVALRQLVKLGFGA